jgi:hypothetical protein
MVATNQIELIVAAMLKPTIEQVIGQPGAPTSLHRHAREDQGDCNHNACDKQQKVEHRQPEHGRAVEVLQRVEDGAVPEIHRVGCRQAKQDDNYEDCGEYTRPPPAIVLPIVGGAAPEPSHERVTAQFGDLLSA